MTSLMFTDCFASTTSHPSRPNGAFLPRRWIEQLSLRSTASVRGHTCILSIRSSSSDTAMVIYEFPVTLKIIDEIRTDVIKMKKSIGAVPGLAVVLLGDSNYSESYESYEVPCMLVQMKSFEVRLAKDSSEEEVFKSISRLNDDPCVHGIIVPPRLLPSMQHMDEKIVNAISAEKDANGFHPLNIGRLAMRGREPFFAPCAPKGYIEVLHRYNIEIKGKRAVVIGRSNDFGIPIALLLQREDATVTIIHSETKNPEEITRQADIVISDIGKPNMVRGSWIKPGAVVINIGTHLVRDPNAPEGFRIVGDICYEEVCKVASAITPFEGGPGFLTLTMLLSNVLTSAKRFHNFIQMMRKNMYVDGSNKETINLDKITARLKKLSYGRSSDHCDIALVARNVCGGLYNGINSMN
ncbi:unnamed protein product [Arabis nemorensis]|uniref:ATP-cone domain-containing protein n=1 Tax=Arabis nemorensis TaxID=586526 RepID=A0A565BDZ2_9BRAS|nr:unnamed protein product [Arabis nemorensis]